MIKTTSYKIVMAALISGCFFMYGCENDMATVRELGTRKSGVDEGKNIDSYLSMNGKVKAHLTAPTVLRYQGDSASKAEFPNSLHVDFYNDSAKKESELRADYGRYVENEKKVYLRDNVVAFNIKGDTLYCEDLVWDQNTGRFRTDKKVIWSQAFRKNLFVGLKGMECDQDMSNINLFIIQEASYFTVPDSTVRNTTADTTKRN
jgi:LPS export ABC transporter protein LptC